MKTKILREEFTSRLAELNQQLEPKQKDRIAVELDLNQVSVKRYLRGEVANIEVAEAIIVQAEALLAKKLEPQHN